MKKKTENEAINIRHMIEKPMYICLPIPFLSFIAEKFHNDYLLMTPYLR